MEIYRLDITITKWDAKKLAKWVEENIDRKDIIRAKVKRNLLGYELAGSEMWRHDLSKSKWVTQLHYIYVLKDQAAANKLYRYWFKTDGNVAPWEGSRDFRFEYNEDYTHSYWAAFVIFFFVVQYFGFWWASVIILFGGMIAYVWLYFAGHLVIKGESLFRLPILMGISIYGFEQIYQTFGIIGPDIVSGAPKVSHESLDCLYFSIVTWTTLGYGDFRPTEEARMFASLEAVMGYFFMGIFIAGLFDYFQRK